MLLRGSRTRGVAVGSNPPSHTGLAPFEPVTPLQWRRMCHLLLRGWMTVAVVGRCRGASECHVIDRCGSSCLII